VLARCKFLLKPEVYEIPRRGTAVLHPGITPQYRNAHGCFWALVNRDLARVGMSLLQVDSGIDTGPVYLQASYPFNEKDETHVVIQHRVVLENLDEIARVLHAIKAGTATPSS
jgi:methionyl-tRNA formyltransferase